MSRSCRTRGFTLIEVLVVVAIIALLISILLPSLKTARDLARDTQCASNLKQLGIGVEFYQQAFKDMVVPHLAETTKAGVTKGQVWHRYLVEQYMQQSEGKPFELVSCPRDASRPFDEYFRSGGGTELERRWQWDPSYGLSHVTYQKYEGSTADTEAHFDQIPINRIKRPMSNMVLITDSGERDLRRTQYIEAQEHGWKKDWNLVYSNYEGYVVDDDHRYPGKRHTRNGEGGCNVLFLDKHVDRVVYDDLIRPQGEERYPGWYRTMEDAKKAIDNWRPTP